MHQPYLFSNALFIRKRRFARCAFVSSLIETAAANSAFIFGSVGRFACEACGGHEPVHADGAVRPVARAAPGRAARGGAGGPEPLDDVVARREALTAGAHV